MEKTILIVDDEDKMRRLLADTLHKEGYSTIEASNGEEAYDIFIKRKEDISLILMDIMMPKMDGYETSKAIKSTSTVPIILLTAKNDERDEIFGYENGIDDYITKPFSLKILVARIKAIIKRINQEPEEDEYIEIGNISIDNKAHVVKVDNEVIHISYMEYKLLNYFIKNKNKALSREQILTDIWGYTDYFGDTRTIDTHIKVLRKKINKDYIKTIYSIGYKFSVD